MELGMVGLGRMGGNMAERLRRHGHDVLGYDREPGVGQFDTVEAMVAALPRPRAVWVMVPAGPPTQTTLRTLEELLDDGDVVVDGGNSHFRSSQAHGADLAELGIGFIDAGVSGGVWGLEEGYCLMVGGTAEDVARLQPAFDALTPEGGFAHVGPVGAGHFTKMIHNGVEYGMMQSFAEGYELLTRCGLDIDVPAALSAWRHGSVVRSWLLELLVRALEQDPGLTDIRGYAPDSGEGRWTVQEGVEAGVPTPAISAALYARFASQHDDSEAMKVIAALRNQFGGHAVREAGSDGD